LASRRTGPPCVVRSAPPCRVQQAMRSACAGSSRGLLSSAVLHLYSKHADALAFRLTRRGANHRGTVSAERDAGRLQAARQDFWADHAASEARYHAGLASPILPRRTCLADLPRWKGPDSGTCATVMTPTNGGVQ